MQNKTDLDQTESWSDYLFNLQLYKFILNRDDLKFQQ